jgi:hypothetical protein
LFIAVHELLHACGLENADHGADGVFAANPGTLPGDIPSQDKITVSAKTGGKLRTSVLPPLFIDAATARVIQRLWQK